MYSRFVRIILPASIFMLSFLLPTQLGKHFFFSFSYLSGIRIDYLAPTLYLIDILSFFLLVFFGIQYFKTFKKIKRPLSKSLLFFVVLVVLIALNWYFSLSKELWLYRFARILQVLFLFQFFRHNGNKRNLYPFVLWGLFFGAFFELALSISQLASRHSLQGIWYFFGERQFMISTPGIAKARMLGAEFLRPYGTFSHPNSLAGFYLLIYTFILTQKKVTNIYFKNPKNHPPVILRHQKSVPKIKK